MTRAELMSRMTSAEFVEWFAYFAMVDKATTTVDEAAETAPNSDWGASLKGRMLAWQASRKGSA